jgi:hypothetical protein
MIEEMLADPMAPLKLVQELTAQELTAQERARDSSTRRAA